MGQIYNFYTTFVIMKGKIIIAIDGYSSTGKSTFAKLIASKLGYIHIDTGAIYRAVTLLSIQNHIISKNNIVDKDSLLKLLSGSDKSQVSFKATGKNGESQTYLNGINVEKDIRSLDVSNKVSHIATIPFVREYVDNILKEIGKNKGVVMDGRDIGTAVFPEAELKLFMTADPNIRAERRLKEMNEKGINADFNDVLKNILERDYIDEHRAIAPLTRAKDSIILDNSHLTIEEQLNWVFKILRDNSIINQINFKGDEN